MSDISGTEPGTVLDAEELDLSRSEQYFQIQEINEEIRGEISGKSYTENPDIFLEDLRYLKVLHYNYGERKIFCVYGKNSSLIRNRYV